MSAEQEVVILTRLAGQREFIAGTEAEAASLRQLGVASDEAGMSFDRTSRRGYLMNQTLFTMRRLIYGTTLALIAGGAAALKWGWGFNSAMQTARVALAPLQSSTFNVNKELDYLFNFTKYTPFQFKDITIAFRTLYGAMQPLGISANTVNQLIKAIADSLAFVGRTSPGALNRTMVALQHLAFQGRLTGQTTLQLARDGIPIYAALRTELGLTADQIHNIGKLGIPTSVVLQAIIKYIRNTPGYANAAYRQATGSLTGLFTTFKDNISQIMGAAESGFFHKIQNRLIDMNSWFDRLQSTIKGKGITGIVDALFGPGAVKIWNQLTTAVNNFWKIFTTLVKDIGRSRPLWAALYLGLFALNLVLGPVVWLLKNFGWTLNVLIPLWLSYKAITLGIIAVEKIQAFWTAVNTRTIKEMTFAQWLLNGALRAYNFILLLANGETRASILLQIRLRLAVAATATMLYLRLIPAFIRTGVAAAAAWLMALGPLGWIIIAVVALIGLLVGLYFKWRWFHNLMNTVATGIKNGVLWAFTELWKIMVKVYDIGKKIIDHIMHPLSTIKDAGHSLWNMVTHPFGSLIPGLASGGTVSVGGMARVGEHGPENVFLPTGATVMPLAHTVNPLANLGSMFTIVIDPADVNIDGKKVAQVVWSYQSAYVARA